MRWPRIVNKGTYFRPKRGAWVRFDNKTCLPQFVYLLVSFALAQSDPIANGWLEVSLLVRKLCLARCTRTTGQCPKKAWILHVWSLGVFERVERWILKKRR